MPGWWGGSTVEVKCIAFVSTAGDIGAALARDPDHRPLDAGPSSPHWTCSECAIATGKKFARHSWAAYFVNCTSTGQAASDHANARPGIEARVHDVEFRQVWTPAGASSAERRDQSAPMSSSAQFEPAAR